MLSLHRNICLCIASVIALATGSGERCKTYNSLFSAHSGITDTTNKDHIVFEKHIDPEVTSDTPSCIIPFSRAGNLILIRAKADTTEGNFILDTGAPKLVLNITYFRDYLSSAVVEDDPGGITGSASAANPTIVTKLSFGPIKYSKVEADRINLGHIENNKGLKILGLLGMSLFKRFEMIIDYEKSLIYLHLIDKKESNTYKSETLKDTSMYHTLPVSILDNKVLAHGEIAGKKLAFVIDTGSESNVLDSRLSGKVFENVTITRRVTLAGTGSRKVEALYGEMKNIKLDKLEISVLPVLVTNLEKMCFLDSRCPDGVLGFDFLSLHKIGFNFVTRKMYIWK